MFVPGLAQTADYYRTEMQAADVPPEQIEGRVAERMDRRQILTRNKPPKFDMILSETVLRRVVGGPKIMTAQLADRAGTRRVAERAAMGCALCADRSRGIQRFVLLDGLPG
jgi:hypothetical protein